MDQLLELSTKDLTDSMVEFLVEDDDDNLWQQGPASFNITAKTDVCTLPTNMPKLIIVYVT